MTAPPKAIPALPCVSLDDTLAFWTALGFTVTYRQKAPNPYGVVARDGYEIHFYGLKGLVPNANFSTCLVIVPEVESLHVEHESAMRASLGRAPGRGLPRISRMRPQQTRFTVTDPSGNSVIFIKHGPEDEERAQAYKDTSLTPLQKSIRLAERLRDYHNDDAAAARALDIALAREGTEAPEDRVTALEARAELAHALDDPALAERLLADAAALRRP